MGFVLAVSLIYLTQSPRTQMAIDAAKHRNATTLLRSTQETYAQGMRDVERCARCRKYGAGVNRALQGAMRRTLEGLRGYAPQASGEGGKG